MQYNWNWGILFQEPYFGWLLDGLRWTMLVSIAGWAIAFSLGSLIGILRTVEFAPARWLAGAYVELFRGVPLLVQLFLWYFVVPELLPEPAGRWLKRDLPNPEFWTAVVCLGTYTASRVAEQVRAGIQSLPRDLVNAALAVGFTPFQAYRYVRLPIAYRILVPPLTTEFLSIFKNSSLALTIGVLELTAQARQIENYTFQGFEAFTAATLLYLAITLSVVGVMRLIDRRTRIAGLLAG